MFKDPHYKPFFEAKKVMQQRHHITGFQVSNIPHPRPLPTVALNAQLRNYFIDKDQE